MEYTLVNIDSYLLILSDDEIKEDNWYYHFKWKELFRLYKDTMRNKAFELQCAKKVIAHLPLNNYPVLDDVDLLPPLKQEDDINNLAYEDNPLKKLDGEFLRAAFKRGYRKAKDKYKYTEEDMFKMFTYGNSLKLSIEKGIVEDKPFGEIFKDMIKHLSQTKLPIAFKRICDCAECIANKQGLSISVCKRRFTTTNSQGQVVWLGEYKY